MSGRISKLILLLTVLALLPSVQSYALEGQWTLTSHKDLKLDPSLEVEFQFKRLIRGKQIVREMIVKSCYDLSYSYQVAENDISISYNSVLGTPRKCGKDEITIIRSKIDTLFYFTIDGSTLKLFNPTGFAPFVFTRKVMPPPKAINGLWQTLTIQGQTKYIKIRVNGTHALMCQGQGVAVYRINGQNQIAFQILQSRGCSQDQLSILRALDTAIFFRIRDFSILYIYNYRMNPVLTAFFAGIVRLEDNLGVQGSGGNNSPPPPTPTQPLQPQPSQPQPISQPIVIEDPIAQPSVIVDPIAEPVQPQQPTQPVQQTPEPPKQIPQTQPQSQNTPNEPDPASSTPNPESSTNEIPEVIVKPESTPAVQPPSQTTDTQPASQATIPISLDPIEVNPQPSPQFSTQVQDNIVIHEDPLLQTSDNSGASSNTQNPSTITTTTQISSSTTQNIDSTTNTQIPQETTPKSTTPQQNQNQVDPVENLTQLTPQTAQDLIPFQESDLDGKWFLKSIDGESIISDLGSYYLIVTSGSRRVIMYGGCNVQFSTYTLDANQIQFGGLIGTRRACKPDNDSLVTNPLFKDSSFIQIVDNEMTLYDIMLTELIVFTNVPPQ